MTKIKVDLLQWQWLGFAVIAFFVLMVYYPSFMHVARSDQINYLAEVSNKHDWVSLAINTYDLNRHRIFNPGDQLLFRPVIYFILGTEKYLFGYNFMLWQMAGVAAHLWVVWCLLRLLLRIHKGFFAILLTGFFSLLFINMEMVIWHHITSYMVFWALILTALYHAYVLKQSNQWDSYRWWMILLCLLISVFTYEIGNIYALLIFFYLRYQSPKAAQSRLWWLLAPVLIYGIASLANFYGYAVKAEEGQKILSLLDLWPTLKSLIYANLWWVYSGLFPNGLDLIPVARNIVNPNSLMAPLSITDVSFWLAVGLIILYAGVLSRGWGSDFRKRQGNFLALLAVMIAAYGIIIVLGRVNARGLRVTLGTNLYYNYAFWVMAMIFVYASVDFNRLRQSLIFLKWSRRMVVIFLAVLISINSFLLFNSLKQQVTQNNDILILLHAIDLLVQEKGKEPDFSFYVGPHYPGNFISLGLRKKTDPDTRTYSFIEAIYPQYYRPANQAKYKFITVPARS